MDTNESIDAPRMSVDEGPVASSSTSSADAVAPDATEDEQATSGQDNSKSPENTGEAGSEPTASNSTIANSEPAPQAGTSAAGATAATAKSEPETRIWRPVPPGTMPKPRRLHIRAVYLFRTLRETNAYLFFAITS